MCNLSRRTDEAQQELGVPKHDDRHKNADQNGKDGYAGRVISGLVVAPSSDGPRNKGGGGDRQTNVDGAGKEHQSTCVTGGCGEFINAQ